MTKEEGALDALFQTVSLAFRVLGGRVFAHHAEPGKLNRQIIELKCEAETQFFRGSSVIIGNDKHARPQVYDDREESGERPVEEEEGWRLESFPTIISLYEVDETWLRESADRNDGSPNCGEFEYRKIVTTDDGVVDDKRPTVFAWAGVGPETFKMLRDRVLNFEKYDFSIGLDVMFPEGSVESAWMGRLVRWDGEKPLPVTAAVVVWKREDWSPEFYRKERLVPRRKRDEPYDPPREHVELLEASSKIETALSRLTVPAWLTVALLLILLLRR